MREWLSSIPTWGWVALGLFWLVVTIFGLAFGRVASIADRQSEEMRGLRPYEGEEIEYERQAREAKRREGRKGHR